MKTLAGVVPKPVTETLSHLSPAPASLLEAFGVPCPVGAAGVSSRAVSLCVCLCHNVQMSSYYAAVVLDQGHALLQTQLHLV